MNLGKLLFGGVLLKLFDRTSVGVHCSYKYTRRRSE